jgi:hypothetical protein
MTEMTPNPTVPAAKPKPRPRPQVMRLTDAAATRIRELTERADSEIVGLRVGIKNGGCAGQSYTVEYAHDIKPTDEIVEDKGVKILVDPKAVSVPARHRDGLQDRPHAGPVRVQQPEPDLGLWLRRVRATDAGEDRRLRLSFHN